ncbi:MAG: hypothetical protein C4541_09695 [Candidatus Auribacter fodinae]|uniref:Uncharacterized protein n=1 Tax=Candidatus Auribacter fodinae TaxID=2093366 RepID=A0A3A4QVE2_9BACT|nr:MAG: hypothetical protein C4541_09695 [Candidatus Auribacter fodinae]
MPPGGIFPSYLLGSTEILAEHIETYIPIRPNNKPNKKTNTFLFIKLIVPILLIKTTFKCL